MPAHDKNHRSYRLRAVTRLVSHLTLVLKGKRLPPRAELAERHGCSTRTIRRDLEAIEAAGWPVQGGAL